ncbi:ceramide synthase [Lampetra fluviatilis]
MIGVFLLGCAFFPGLFVALRGWLQQQLGCGRGEAVILSARLVSVVQALMASASGYIIVCMCQEDVLYDRHWLATWYVWFATPYFLYDVCAMFLCHWHRRAMREGVGPARGNGPGLDAGGRTKSRGLLLWDQLVQTGRQFIAKETLMVMHHVGVCMLCFPVSTMVRGELGDFFQGCLFMAEVSTPFVCFGKILLQFKQQGTLLFKLNGALMLATFFLFRLLVFPYMYWEYGRRVGLSVWAVPFSLPLVCNVAATLLLAPQLYWFILICRAAASRKGKGFRGPPPPPPPAGAVDPDGASWGAPADSWEGAAAAANGPDKRPEEVPRPCGGHKAKEAMD